MAKIRPEEPKAKKGLKARIPDAGVFFKSSRKLLKKTKNPVRIMKDPMKNTEVPAADGKVQKAVGKIRDMDTKQGKRLLVCLTGGFLLASYLLLVHVYTGRFIPGTYINGINVGGRTPEQVENLLQKRIESYTLSLTMRSTKAAAEYLEEVKAIGQEEPIEPVEYPVEDAGNGATQIIAPIEYSASDGASAGQTVSVSADGSVTDNDVTDESISDESISDESLSDTLTSDEAAREAAEKEKEKKTPEEKSQKSQDVAFKDVVVEKIPGKTFDYTYIPSGEVADIQKTQNPFAWVIGGIGDKIGFRKLYTVASATEYNQEKLKNKISELAESDKEKQMAPTNAQIILKHDNTFEIIPETYGTALDTDKLLAVANKAVKSSTQEVNIAKNEDLYEQPVVFATNTDLVNQEEALNKFLDTEVTYQLPDSQTRILGRDTTSQWVSLQDNGYYYLDEAVIADCASQYAAALASEINVVRDTRDFESTNAGVVQVECERYGRIIDEDGEAAKLAEEFLSCTSETREPIYAMNNLERDSTFGGTYVEVDKCEQTVYYYENYEMKLATECVTGTETNASRRTPTGVYSIFDKERNRTLRGSQLADGSYQYASFVNYWMPFNGGIGLHDATWRGDFGGGIYWYSGSHGCVNIPYWAAQELYSMVDIGTTVIVIDY